MSLHELFNAVIDYRVTTEGLGCAAVFVVVGLIGANMESILGLFDRPYRRPAHSSRKTGLSNAEKEARAIAVLERKKGHEELAALRARRVANTLTDEERARMRALEEFYGYASWQGGARSILIFPFDPRLRAWQTTWAN